MPRTIPTRAEEYCRKAERDRLIETLPENRPDLALVFWLGFFAGLRIREITQARTRWIDLEQGLISVQNSETWTTKDKAHRRIKMSARLQAFLRDYMELWPELKGADSSDFLLRPDKKQGKKCKGRNKRAWRLRYDPRKPFKKHVTEQGLEWVSFHTMRHTWATLHAIAGTPLTTIARELGDDPKTTFDSYIGYTRHNEHSSATD